MPNDIAQDGVGQPSPQPGSINFPQTGSYRTARPQGDMYPRGANHFQEYITNPLGNVPPGLNFRTYNIAGTWLEVNLYGTGYDGAVSIVPLFVKLNDPANAMGDGFFGLFYNTPTMQPYAGFVKPIRVRGIPFNRIFISTPDLAFLNTNPFYLHVSYGTDTDFANVDVR